MCVLGCQLWSAVSDKYFSFNLQPPVAVKSEKHKQQTSEVLFQMNILPCNLAMIALCHQLHDSF